MIANKDLSIDSENGKIVLNGDKYDLGTQGEIDTAVKDVYSVMGQNGAKNLIPYPYYESDHTESGITWTVNSDGSVTANGTATANSTFIFRQRTEQTKFVEKNTSYILSGCPGGGSTAKYLLNFFVKKQDDTNVASGTDYGNGATINMPDQDYYGIYAFARVISGQTVSNLTFKPMLRLAADTDNTYQPYAMTNKQLTEKVEELAGSITYTDIPVNKSTTGYAVPVESAGGVYYEALATYAALGISKDKILNIILVDCHDTAKSFNYYLGAASVGVLTDSAVSIYKDTAAADLTLRIVYKN